MFARKGRTTFKTADYLRYQEEIRDEIEPPYDWPFGSNEVIFSIIAGVSNRGFDLDNTIKPLLDTYQSIYEDFNDNKVYITFMVKRIVPKGEEYINVAVMQKDG